MVYFTEIKKTTHYVEQHEKEVPWSEVVTLIFSSAKQIRKKGNRYEIENERYYVLMEIKDGVIYVINAKRDRSK